MSSVDVSSGRRTGAGASSQMDLPGAERRMFTKRNKVKEIILNCWRWLVLTSVVISVAD